MSGPKKRAPARPKSKAKRPSRGSATRSSAGASKRRSTGSKGEETFAAQLRAAGVGFQRELMLIPGRRFRFDFLIDGSDLVVEIEGGTWSGGRHTTGAGFRSDCYKYNRALELGYRVLRYTTDMVTKREAITQVLEILGAEALSERV